MSPPGGGEGPTPAARAAARAGLYVHVPFCVARCAYCDFASGSLSAEAVERWLAGVEREAASRAPVASGLVFTSVYVGGGTPSTLAPEHVHHLLMTLRCWFAIAPEAEITLEANPESAGARRLAAWRAAGVNRLSIGAQSFHADELAALGRIHRSGGPGGVFARARTEGFRRLSLDLMFGFPGHTLERWVVTLERALRLEPEHLSVYAFVAEAGTSLGDAVLSGRTCLPSEEAQAEAYELLFERATRAGLTSYETSNLCRPGAEALHNLVYWLRRPYVGLGPSAHGLAGGRRYGNHRGLVQWLHALERGASPAAEEEAESPATVAREVLMLGLRLTTGMRAADYDPAIWTEVTRRYGTALAEAVATGRLLATAGGFAMPRTLRFVADDVLAWIEARAEACGFDRRSAHSLPSKSCPRPPSSATGVTQIRT